MATTSARATEAPTVVLGLLSDPGLPSKLSEELAGQLPGLLYRETGGRAKWAVRTATEALLLDENGTLPTVEIGRRRMVEEGWDLIILVTERPDMREIDRSSPTAAYPAESPSYRFPGWAPSGCARRPGR